MKAKVKIVGKTNTDKSKAKRHPAVSANARGGKDTRKKIHTPAKIPEIQPASLLERVSDGFVAFDAEMNYTYVNTRGGEMLGRKPEDLIGKNYWEEYPEAKGSVFANAYVRALREQTPLQIEDYYEPFDRWFENRIYPSKEGLSIFFHDITDHKKAEMQIRASEERLARIVETIPDGIVIADREGAVIFANPPAERILGLSRTDITQCSYNDPQWKITALDVSPFPDEDLPFARVKAGGGSVYDVEHAIVYPDGRRAALSINASPLRDAKENFDGMVASITDITERKRMENLLTGEKQVLEMIATGETMPKILDAIARNIESQSVGMFCTILLLDADGLHVRHGAAPSMKETFIRAIDGQPIGPNAGSCGTAAYRKEPVYVTDIASDPLWVDYRQVALEHGLRACWSTPIKSSEGRVLGTFAMYYGEPRAPQPADLRLIEFATHLAGIGIERKQVEEALRRSEQTFSVIFQKAPFAAGLTNIPDGTYLEANEQFERVFGFSREEIVGKTSLELGMYPDPEMRERSAAMFKEQGFVRNLDMRLQTRSGEIRDVLINSDLVDIGGEKYILTTANDITERKQAQDELQAHRQLLETVVNYIPASVSLLRGSDLRLQLINPAYQAIAPGKEMLGKTWDELWEETGQNFTAICRQVLETGEPYNVVDELNMIRRTPEGPVEPAYFSWSLHRVRLPGDEGWGLLGTAWETTDRKLAEDALRESEERYRLLVEKSPYSIGIHQDGKLVFANPAAVRLFGAQNADDLAGKSVLELVSPETRDAARERIGRMLQGETGLYPTEDRYLQLDGTPFPVEVTAAPFIHEGRPAIQVIALDITERKRADEELRLSRDRLAELSLQLVQTHETESRAIGRELHDQIGQMLTALKLIMEIAPQLPPELRDKKHAQAQELVDDLMNRVSRLSLELRPAMLDDLGLIPALLWHINRYQEQTNIAVDFKHSGAEGIRFDPEIETTAYRIVQESLTNVARHAHATHVRLDVRVLGEQMEIQIEDNGTGFDPQAAFDKQRGLSGMRERVKLLGGSFEIESQPGNGTKQFIQIPIAEHTP